MRATNEEKRVKVALALAKKLNAASEAMRQFVHACIDCGEPYPLADDTRRTMQETLTEYSGHLELVYGSRMGGES